MNTFTLTNCYILDGSKDMKPFKGSIEVIDGIITRIGDFEIKTKSIDLNGQYVLPGLINLHSHLPASGKVNPNKKVANLGKTADFVKHNPVGRLIGLKLCSSNAKAALYSGVTSVRTVGGLGNFDTILRDKINSNKQIGPRLIVSNEAIGVEKGHMVGTVAIAAHSVDEALNLTKNRINENVDIIKLMITGGVLDCEEPGKPGTLRMKGDMIKAVCDLSHDKGLKVAAHVECSEGIELAILNGVDSIEHGASCSDSVLKVLKDNKGMVVATYSPAVPLAYLDPQSTGYGEEGKTNATIVLNGIIDCANQCLKLGITVGLGTDSGSPFSTHYDFYRELLYFVKYAKVSNSFALHTATLVNAKIAGIDNITGSIEVGKCSDLIVVEKNPLDDLYNLKDIKYVFTKNLQIKNPKNKHIKGYDELLDNIYERI